MRKAQNIILYIFLLITSQELYSAILTVNNSNPSPGQYASLQTAIDVANTGDTLLIHRSSISYGNATITKMLVLIGEGTLPNKAPASTTTTIGDLTLGFNSSLLINASKTKIIGLLITNLNLNAKDATNQFSVDSITISYSKINRINLTGKVYNLEIYNSFINAIANGNIFNAIFQYNFINSISTTNNQGANNLIINNIIFSGMTLNGGIIANNILYNTSTANFINGIKNTILSNNIMYGTQTVFNASDFTTNGNSSINNQFNVDPLFVNPALFNTVFAYTHTTPTSGPFADFHLLSGSPAKNTGTDGTDPGIYGGTTPWRDGSTTDSRYRYFPLPNAIPVITGMTINNPVVNSGGTLQIQLNATTQP